MTNTFPDDFLQDYNDLKRRVRMIERQEIPARLPYVIERAFYKASIADNTATDVFRIQTNNETASADGGGYAVFVHALIGHNLSALSTNTAVKSYVGHFARTLLNSGSTGVTTAVSEIDETASAATTSATRDIGTVTMSVAENTEYQVDVQFTVDLSGSALTTAEVIAYVRFIHYGFLTTPTLSQL